MVEAPHAGNRRNGAGSANLLDLGEIASAKGCFLRRVAYIIARGNADVCRPTAFRATGVIGLPPSSWEPPWADAGTSHDTNVSLSGSPHSTSFGGVSHAGLLSQVPRPP